MDSGKILLKNIQLLKNPVTIFFICAIELYNLDMILFNILH